MASLIFLAGASLITVTALSAPAAAQDIAAVPLTQTVSDVAPQAPSVADTRVASPFETSAVTEDTLGSIAGREDTTQISRAEQTSHVSRNSIGDNSRTGDARIADNAFQNLSGLSILNVNTGNNVAINAAMNVNIAINPAP